MEAQGKAVPTEQEGVVVVVVEEEEEEEEEGVEVVVAVAVTKEDQAMELEAIFQVFQSVLIAINSEAVFYVLSSRDRDLINDVTNLFR